MKALLVFLLVAACEGMRLETRTAQLAAPCGVKVAVMEGPAFEVSWDKVEEVDKKDPILGYKLKIWEVKSAKVTKYVIMNGEVKPMEEDLPMELIAEPTTKPEEVTVGPAETKATFKKVALDVTYEIRVAAYTKAKEGPLSSAIRIKLCKKKT
ncbi:unnamed protein product [Chrysodeixis includens]|uniref:Fibronectin type-III domain-containing protein n=1 Tax=Chrysodeixis includens TaxID=689277 RepID=A0A9P0FWX7_CHRIL|nr:unnamed protein product [Chrysodeixis includens]